MNITDKMGGVRSAIIIPVRKIQSFTISGEKVLIIADEEEKIHFSHRKNGILSNISSSNTKSGTIYNVDLQIQLKDDTGIQFLPFNQNIAIVTDNLGNRTVLGTPSFPLTVTKRPEIAPEPSGFTGTVISLAGQQPFYPLNY